MFPEVIIHPVVNVSRLTLLMRYPYYWNLQFLNNTIIIKTKVLLSQSYVTLADLICFHPLTLFLTKTGEDYFN
jgi:hypothetical protein